jgi:hypothetical protein
MAIANVGVIDSHATGMDSTISSRMFEPLLRLGVIISGATTFLSYFFAGPPVSFYLAQCELD